MKTPSYAAIIIKLEPGVMLSESKILRLRLLDTMPEDLSSLESSTASHPPSESSPDAPEGNDQ